MQGVHKSKGVAIATDIDDGSTKPSYDLPPPSKAGAVALEEDKDGKHGANGQAIGKHGVQMGEATGWAPRFGWPAEPVGDMDNALDHSTWLESRLPDKLYGGKLLQPL